MSPNARFHSLVDLDDAELERQLLQAGNLYPTQSKEGSKLFDANGNMPLSDEEREHMILAVETKFSEIFDLMRIDRNDPNSTDTPFRLARMWVNELFAGRYSAAPKITVFPNRRDVGEIVISKGIKVMSVCSHHWQPISGVCSIGYIS